MIQVEMSRDIKDFEPKLIGCFSGRQLICIGIACAYGLPFAYLFLNVIKMNISTALTIVIVLMALPIACGYVKMYGMYLDVFFFKCVLPMYLSPTKRKYKTTNSFAYLDPEKSKVVVYSKNTKPPKMTKQEKKKRKLDMAKFKAAE